MNIIVYLYKNVYCQVIREKICKTGTKQSLKLLGFRYNHIMEFVISKIRKKKTNIYPHI